MSFGISDQAASMEQAERAVLVGIERKGDPDAAMRLASTLSELERLSETAGASVVATTSQRLVSPNPRTFVGSGKAEEIASLCLAHAADVVIFDEELTPAQQGNLEKIMPQNVKVIDRTALILDIFALHATSKEGRLQVRLAQNQYLLPRLRGMWAHLASNRMGGGVGSRFGEGESQLEVDRRLVRKRITTIRRELDHLASVRAVQRRSRRLSGVFRIAEAGYTNAGKSSLIHALTGADVLSYDKLFATLDSTTRRLSLPEGRDATITDTVGFIQKLPTNLIEAFRSTLDEISEADLILHVVDASSPRRDAQAKAVVETLGLIGAQDIPCMVVCNKVDLLGGEERAELIRQHSDACLVSARTGEGMDALRAAIVERIAAYEVPVVLSVPFDRGDAVSRVHSECTVLEESYDERGTTVVARIPSGLLEAYAPFIVRDDD